MTGDGKVVPPLLSIERGAEIRRVVQHGGVLGIPTESTYGLAVDPRQAQAVEAIYQLKRREARKPLPLVVADAGQAAELGLDTQSPAFRFGLRYWPAPLTVLIPVRDPSVLALGDLEFVAVRIPDYPLLAALLQTLGHGVTATSANLSGEPPLVEAGEVQELLGALPGSAVVTADRLAGGAPSTVVAWQEGTVRVLRQGRFEVPEDN